MEEMQKLKKVIQQLRSPNGCPWDREQTHESLREKLLEECYEVIDAIDNEDMENLKEELGDILLHIFLHSQIAMEKEIFSIEQVTQGIIDKLIRRHPHVFQSSEKISSQEVTILWEEIKKKEKKSVSENKNWDIGAQIPKSAQPLLSSIKLGKKASKFGFDWENSSGVWEKISEEIEELKNEVKKQDKKNMEMEFGDLLFALCQWARHESIDPSIALNKANQKFANRFNKMLNDFSQDQKYQNIEFAKISAKEKELLWQRVKQNLNDID